MKRIDIKEFCERSNIKHNNRYDYSLVDYKNNRTKVKIICELHGIFDQAPDDHMRGKGCSKCSGKYNYTNDEYVSLLINIFGDRYNYDKVLYISQKKKVIITCYKHGDVEKHPQILLRGSGCSKCETINYKINLYHERFDNELRCYAKYLFEKGSTLLECPFFQMQIFITFAGNQKLVFL